MSDLSEQQVMMADAAAGGCAVVRAGARNAVRAQPIDVAPDFCQLVRTFGPDDQCQRFS
jgi:hypothetical protein